MKQHSCPKCATIITVNDNDKFVACPKCFSYHEVSASGIKFVSTFQLSNRPKEVCFDLGQNLVIKGLDYKITGITQRNDATYKSFKWREYNLINDLGEQAFLNEYNGNWLLVKPLAEQPSDYTSGNHTFIYDDIEFGIFQSYYQNVNWAIGNFDFDVTDSEKIYSREFIAPPKMLIFEVKKESKEKNPEWYEGEYVEADKIYQEYLKLNSGTGFPSKYGVGATEPYQSNFYFEDAKKMSLLALAALLAIQIFFLIISPTKTVFNKTFGVAELKYDSTNNFYTTPKPIVSESFTIEKSGKIKLELESSVDNSWLESNITLINESTLEELPILIGNEYYHGVEGGENWTEGSTSESKDYSSVPAGKYHLLIETSTPFISGTYAVKLITGGVYWINILILAVLIACVPTVLYFQEREFEKQRWADSDYSPYITEDE
ncbi:hypothetical protein EMA8858_00725 [Emticicia aquatica]|uniref:DUF4178 domain-containing protein n=1 Tax=Emticicia aquatica TaxID=1681835 RepID=A0ABN8ENZ6_9BACT|nr:DUF4178 domain-containing protein [Emticicia aquatica]CAH0994614.1 hypothetical protein EMA8858_00725 [Emticicia aquatica]